MSELKAYLCIQAREIENKTFSCYNQTLAVKNAPEATMAQVYLKSEADKVIAELKADYKEACGRLQTANLIKNEQLAAARHHKYKRGLAMARMCEERSSRYDALQERYGLDWGREIEFNYRWYKRWLELAETFKDKEAK